MHTIIKPEEDYNRTAEEGRVKIWKRGIGYMMLHPVFGVGAANFPVAEGTISPLAGRTEVGLGVKWGAAHDSFVQIGAELGIPVCSCSSRSSAAALSVWRGYSRRPRARRAAGRPAATRHKP